MAVPLKTRRMAAPVAALLAFALLIAAALDLRPANQQADVASGCVKLILGALALGAAIRLSDRLPTLAQPITRPLDRAARFAWLWAGIGLLLLIALTGINAGALPPVSSWLQYLLLMGGVLLVGYGLGGAPLPRALPRVNGTALALAATLALALLLRVWNLDGTQRELLDELHFSDGIIALEQRPDVLILAPMTADSPYTWVYPLWQSAGVALLGHTFTGFRAVSAVIGTLTVLAAFGLADAIFERRTALLAALVLATFPPHVHFSRTAIIQIADPLFGTLALMFVARALRNNRRIEWALAGVTLGMTQYFYEGARLLFPPLLIGFVVLLALRGQMRGKGRGLLILLLAALIVGAPPYATWIASGKPLFGRYDVSGLGASYWQAYLSGGDAAKIPGLIQHLLSGFLIYGASPDASVYYGGGQALVLDYLLPFFLFGCFYLAWRYPSPAFVIPLWIAATALGNGLLTDPLVASRYEEVLPALALAIAAGVCYLLAFFEPLLRSHRARQAIPVLAVGAIAAAQIGYYFGPHLSAFATQVRDFKPYRDGVDAASRAADLPGNTQVYLIGQPKPDQTVPRGWLDFLSLDGNPLRYYPLLTVTPDTISPKFLLGLTLGVNYAFFVDPTDSDAIAQIVRYFPDTAPAQYSTWDIPADKEYVLLFAPATPMPFREPIKRR